MSYQTGLSITEQKRNLKRIKDFLFGGRGEFLLRVREAATNQNIVAAVLKKEQDLQKEHFSVVLSLILGLSVWATVVFLETAEKTFWGAVTATPMIVSFVLIPAFYCILTFALGNNRLWKLSDEDSRVIANFLWYVDEVSKYLGKLGRSEGDIRAVGEKDLWAAFEHYFVGLAEDVLAREDQLDKACRGYLNRSMDYGMVLSASSALSQARHLISIEHQIVYNLGWADEKWDKYWNLARGRRSGR